MPRKRRTPMITVFGSSRPRKGDALYTLAEELGSLLADRGFALCNGGYGGIMEASAKGAKGAGGTTLGVLCEKFGKKPNTYIDKTVMRATLMDRLTTLIERGDAYVALQGSTGTLLELAAVWEMVNKEIISPRPIVVIGTFWKEVIRTLENELTREGAFSAASLVSCAPNTAAGVEMLASWFAMP